jgi:Pyridoxal-phosphate dependent enzyme
MDRSSSNANFAPSLHSLDAYDWLKQRRGELPPVLGRLAGSPPESLALVAAGLCGHGTARAPKNLSHDHIDEGVKIGDQDAFGMCWRMARREGILLGGSSGALLAAAAHRASTEVDDILCVLPDGGEKYLETIFNEAWLARNGITLDEPPRRTVIEIDAESPVNYDILARLLCGTSLDPRADRPSSKVGSDLKASAA